MFLDVKSHVQDVAILYLIRLAFEALDAAASGLGAGAGLDEVPPADHLAADEATRDVGVDRGRSVERGRAPLQRPRARLLLPRGVEDDEPERLGELTDDLLEGGAGSVAELRRLLIGELAELGLEREVGPAGTVDDRDQRLRGQRLELPRQLFAPIAQRPLFVDVREQPLEVRDLGAQLRAARLRVFANALEPARDVVAVGDEQLEVERLELKR